MTDLMACEKTVRIIEVDGDANSDAMAAAVQHIQQKKGADTGYRYVVKGPNYSCAVEHNGANWAIVDYSDSDKAPEAVASPEPSALASDTEKGPEQSTVTTPGDEEVPA